MFQTKASDLLSQVPETFAVYVRIVFTFYFERFLFIISTLLSMILFDSDKQNVFLLLSTLLLQLALDVCDFISSRFVFAFSLDASHRERAHSEDNFLLLTRQKKIKKLIGSHAKAAAAPRRLYFGSA